MPSDNDKSPHANGDLGGGEGEESGLRLQRSALRALVQDFSPLWYQPEGDTPMLL